MKNSLDDLKFIRGLDKSDMLGLLTGFPAQLKNASVINIPDLDAGTEFSNIVFSGVGGSAIGGDIVKCAIIDEIKIPFLVNREYRTPAFVGPETLFFASSYSGNTEETIGAYKEELKKKARIIAITTGGEIEKMARKDGFPVVKLPAGMPPRAAVGYSFVPALNVLSKMGLISDKKNDIKETADLVGGLRDDSVGPDVPAGKNPAKDIASLLYGRSCAVYGGSQHLDCAVLRWRNQFEENSKALASSHFLPEMDHNEIMGFSHPAKALKDTVVVFLKDRGDHPRIKDRIEITASVIKASVHKVIEAESKGNSLIARICSLICMGDFVSFYLAILNGEDPTPVDEITYLKNELAKRKI
ncbi:MAG: bifunctional phosphoglucose/phosphomannose isomerase [Candidatus Omnitrophica bacterium]|nr:bifunctional phosphoglucose/phosphomannose isomerase [Candidatus Omnitrophota bacterium]